MASRTPVNDKPTLNVFLVNAIGLTGQPVSIDQFAIPSKSGLDEQIVFNPANSTAMPVNVEDSERTPTATPTARDKPNHLRGRVRCKLSCSTAT